MHREGGGGNAESNSLSWAWKGDFSSPSTDGAQAELGGKVERGFEPQPVVTGQGLRDLN